MILNRIAVHGHDGVEELQAGRLGRTVRSYLHDDRTILFSEPEIFCLLLIDLSKSNSEIWLSLAGSLCRTIGIDLCV